MQISKVIELKCFGVGVKGEEAFLLRLDNPSGEAGWYRWNEDGFTLISDDDEGDALDEAFAKVRSER